MNKKVVRILASLALAGTLTVGALGMSSCAAQTATYYGEYSYPNAWSPTAPYYGVKVKVEVQSDAKGDRIKSVELVDSAYTEVSDGWGDKQIWFDGLSDLLLSYRGKYLADVLTETVRVNNTSAKGQPEGVSAGDLMISGATQGSGRLLLAVQAALVDAAEQLGYQVKTGEYTYPNAWSPTAPLYGIKVRVVVKDGTILGVGILNSEYTEVSDGWADKNTWISNVYAKLDDYKGRKVDDILAVEVGVNSTSAPGQPESVSDESLVVSGATQGSGRLLLAVQAALGKDVPKFASYKEYKGEYHYPNAWTPTAPEYGIKVKVFVENHTVTKVSIDSSDYVEVTDSWADKNLWINGVDGLLEKYEGKTVAELLSVNVATDTPGGQPSAGQELGGLIITGATQGSGRLLLAVQNALTTGGYALHTGEYSYDNTWQPGTKYGIKVNVLTLGETILNVSVAESDYIEVSDSWEGKDTWLNGVDNLLKSYAGKSVLDVYAAGVTVNAGGPYTPAGQPEYVSDSSLVVSGATQGSGRLLLAVQNALSEMVSGLGYTAVDGEYHYPNAWDETAPHYGIRVRVLVKDNKIAYLTIVPSGYTEVSGGWGDKDIWINGVDALVKKYIGKTVEEITAVEVTTNGGGQPETVSDENLIVSGATQGSGRLMLAVQDALKKLSA